MKRAQDIEAKIIAQLQRRILATDVASIADRKHRLLWLFYRLSGYMGGTYLSRISNPAGNDELARLLQQRISGELRAEVGQALRGKRPAGIEPT